MWGNDGRNGGIDGKLCGEVETENGFCYFRDKLNTSGGY